MVGRDAALAELHHSLQRALHGERRVIFVTGEAGIGKTTLVDAFHQQAARNHTLRVARGRRVEGFGGKEAYYLCLAQMSSLEKCRRSFFAQPHLWCHSYLHCVSSSA